MPRPKSREGNSEQLCIKVSLALLEEIDAARGEQSRPDWGRDAFHAALEHSPPAPHGIKIVTDKAPVSAFPLGADQAKPEPVGTKSRKGDCPHRLPPGAYCKTCG